MKTLIAAAALATVLATPAFAQAENRWGWKGAWDWQGTWNSNWGAWDWRGAPAASASPKSSYAASTNRPVRYRNQRYDYGGPYGYYPYGSYYAYSGAPYYGYYGGPYSRSYYRPYSYWWGWY